MSFAYKCHVAYDYHFSTFFVTVSQYSVRCDVTRHSHGTDLAQTGLDLWRHISESASLLPAPRTVLLASPPVVFPLLLTPDPKGNVGLPGDIGAPGPAGFKGEDGTPGSAGSDGRDGVRGPTGDKGANPSHDNVNVQAFSDLSV